MPRRFAISDIHGCLASFRSLLARIQLQPSDELFLLGDFVDRGPRSKGVIDYIWELIGSDYQIHCLRGNHEQMFLNSRMAPKHLELWFHNGGYQTLEDFGVFRPEDIPEHYFEWMDELPLFFSTPGYLLVHAGLNFNQPDPLADEMALLWQRGWYDRIDREWLGDRIIIHGHTPTKMEDIQQQISELSELPVVNIDAGCAYTSGRLGYLCAFDLDTQELYFQHNVED